MTKKRYDDKTPMYHVAEYYQEQMIKHSDENHTRISNKCARKFILGKMMRIPYFLQTKTLISMEKLGLIKRENKEMIEIISKN